MELMKMMKLNVSCRFIKRYMFSYITKPCSGQDEPYWSKCSLFCLPFKIYEIIAPANRFYVKNIIMIQIIKDYQTVTTAKLMEIALV